MLGTPMPHCSDDTRRNTVWTAPVWLYNTQTGTVYRVVGFADEDSYSCGTDEEYADTAPCIDEGMVPVPLVDTETLGVVEPEVQAGGWRLFARESSVGYDEFQDYHFGAWLYKAYSGAAYYVHVRCEDYLAGCMTAVPVRDTYNQPAMPNPYASGVQP